MKNLSTGTGLALLSAAILGATMIMRYGPADQVAHAAPPMEAVKVITAASTAQVTPTIVWYGTDTNLQGFNSATWSCSTVWRAWSDGRLEAMTTRRQITAYANGNNVDAWCGASGFCTTGWTVVSTSNLGFNAASDINFDSKVDGSDLGQLLASWGDAPRQDIPPSDCPLNLVNPR